MFFNKLQHGNLMGEEGHYNNKSLRQHNRKLCLNIFRPTQYADCWKQIKRGHLGDAVDLSRLLVAMKLEEWQLLAEMNVLPSKIYAHMNLLWMQPSLHEFWKPPTPTQKNAPRPPHFRLHASTVWASEKK